LGGCGDADAFEVALQKACELRTQSTIPRVGGTIAKAEFDLRE
jgi:hypothetical protein